MTNYKGTFAIQSTASPMTTVVASCAVSSISNTSAKIAEKDRHEFTQSAVLSDRKKLSVQEHQTSKISLEANETSPTLIQKSPAVAKR